MSKSPFSRWIHRGDDQKSLMTPSAQMRRRIWRFPALLFALSAAILLAGAAIWLWVGLGPAEGEAPAEVTAAMLADGSAPMGRAVVLRGISVEKARAQVRRAQRLGSVRWTYTGFRVGERRDGQAAQGPDTAPIMLFTAKWLGTIAASITNRPASETVTGVLVENGLPADAYAALEAQGVAIAPRHYVIQLGEDGSRKDYLRLVWLCLIFGGLLALFSCVVAIEAARTRRLLDQVEAGVEPEEADA